MGQGRPDILGRCDAVIHGYSRPVVAGNLVSGVKHIWLKLWALNWTYAYNHDIFNATDIIQIISSGFCESSTLFPNFDRREISTSTNNQWSLRRHHRRCCMDAEMYTRTCTRSRRHFLNGGTRTSNKKEYYKLVNPNCRRAGPITWVAVFVSTVAGRASCA